MKRDIKITNTALIDVIGRKIQTLSADHIKKINDTSQVPVSKRVFKKILSETGLILSKKDFKKVHGDNLKLLEISKYKFYENEFSKLKQLIKNINPKSRNKLKNYAFILNHAGLVDDESLLLIKQELGVLSFNSLGNEMEQPWMKEATQLKKIIAGLQKQEQGLQTLLANHQNNKDTQKILTKVQKQLKNLNQPRWTTFIARNDAITNWIHAQKADQPTTGIIQQQIAASAPKIPLLKNKDVLKLYIKRIHKKSARSMLEISFKKTIEAHFSLKLALDEFKRELNSFEIGNLSMGGDMKRIREAESLEQLNQIKAELNRFPSLTALQDKYQTLLRAEDFARSQAPQLKSLNEIVRNKERLPARYLKTFESLHFAENLRLAESANEKPKPASLLGAFSEFDAEKLNIVKTFCNATKLIESRKNEIISFVPKVEPTITPVAVKVEAAKVEPAAEIRTEDVEPGIGYGKGILYGAGAAAVAVLSVKLLPILVAIAGYQYYNSKKMEHAQEKINEILPEKNTAQTSTSANEFSFFRPKQVLDYVTTLPLLSRLKL